MRPHEMHETNVMPTFRIYRQRHDAINKEKEELFNFQQTKRLKMELKELKVNLLYPVKSPK